jgi:hypothetical protein
MSKPTTNALRALATDRFLGLLWIDLRAGRDGIDCAAQILRQEARSLAALENLIDHMRAEGITNYEFARS